MIGMLC